MKILCQLLALLAISPLLLSHQAGVLLVGADHSLHTHSQLLALLPGTTGSYLRVAFLRCALRYCHPTATVSFGVLFSKADAELHCNVYIGPYCNLGWVRVEQDVLLGSAVQIPSGPNLHGIEALGRPIREQPGQPQRITIGEDSWVGSGAIILANVAPQTVVGAGSVVTKHFPPQSILVGNPARILRSRVTTPTCDVYNDA